MHRLFLGRVFRLRWTPTSLAWLAAIGFLLIGLTASAQEPAAKANDRPANRLARETSPYLLLHAHNPVDWYPWGPEAFAKAKAEDKPIFLSIGYSSCYWCHVMERESFSDPEIARVLNQHFVSIKVDREERPDVDQIYMTALQAFSSGGWPMSMFLLPDGRPFYGETYLPPRDSQGAAGFLTVMGGIAKSWKTERDEINRAADGLTAIVRRKLGNQGNRRRPPLSQTMINEGFAALAGQFDPEYGGFGFNPQNARRPKFPEPVNLVFLFGQHEHQKGKQKARETGSLSGSRPSPLSMSLFTLDRMARGGIRDQLGGGYHRYSVSRYWIVPHFEKMLYDNAQLASIHLKAFETTGDPRWRAEAEATFAFVARTMTSPEGAFYSSLDAETSEGEGAYYVWSRDQVKQVLGEGPDLELFSQIYGLKRDPNFEANRYVLLQPRPLQEQSQSLKLKPEEIEAKLRPLREKLLAARHRRPPPRRDDKILTAWNGLMIAAYADAYRLLKDDAYRRAAERAAEFIKLRLTDDAGRLFRTCLADKETPPGSPRLRGYLEDYAFLIHGLLRLHAATGEPRWLEQARGLADRMMTDFTDREDGGFFFTANDHESLLARPKDPYDGALPGANSMAALDLLALYRIDRDARYLDAAGKTLEAFGPNLVQNPGAMPLMLTALQEYLDLQPAAEPPIASPSPDAERDRIVTASARLLKDQRPAPGAEVKAVVTLSIKKGWHLYANPTTVENLPPTTLSLAEGPATGLTASYPAGRRKTLGSVGNEPIALYEEDVEIPVRIALNADSPAGSLKLLLKLAYQACDDQLCLPPASLTIPLDLGNVEPGGKESRP